MNQKKHFDNGCAKDSLRNCLMRSEAMDLDEIISHLKVDKKHVVCELQKLIDEGEVEVLHPVCVAEPSYYGMKMDAGRTLEHYRLVRETDDAFLWEQEVLIRLPAGRMFKVSEKEERRYPKKTAQRNITVNTKLSSKSAGLTPAFT